MRDATLFALLGRRPLQAVEVVEHGGGLLVRATPDGPVVADPKAGCAFRSRYARSAAGPPVRSCCSVPPTASSFSPPLPTGASPGPSSAPSSSQQDVCNGSGYCVSGCPYGVIDRWPHDGRADKCTLRYDPLNDDPTPACAKACPAKSIQFGRLDELRERADRRLAQLNGRRGRGRAVRQGPGRRRGQACLLFLPLDKPEVHGPDGPRRGQWCAVGVPCCLSAGPPRESTRTAAGRPRRNGSGWRSPTSPRRR
ncbi:4Fe-4S dicluster domain-containing protein [Geodermatophilus nigrescens]